MRMARLGSFPGRMGGGGGGGGLEGVGWPGYSSATMLQYLQTARVCSGVEARIVAG